MPQYENTYFPPVAFPAQQMETPVFSRHISIIGSHADKVEDAHITKYIL